MLPWSPLARGRLTRPWETQANTERAQTDKYGKGLYGATQETDKAVVDQLGQLSETRGLPRAQVALAWLLRKPSVTAPIVGATNPSIWRMRWAPSRSDCQIRKSRRWRSPTSRIPWSALSDAGRLCQIRNMFRNKRTYFVRKPPEQRSD